MTNLQQLQLIKCSAQAEVDHEATQARAVEEAKRLFPEDEYQPAEHLLTVQKKDDPSRPIILTHHRPRWLMSSVIGGGVGGLLGSLAGGLMVKDDKKPNLMYPMGFGYAGSAIGTILGRQLWKMHQKHKSKRQQALEAEEEY